MKTLDTAHDIGGGSQSMRIQYDVSANPEAFVTLVFPTPQDWSKDANLYVWYLGSSSNSADSLDIQLECQGGCGACGDSRSPRHDEWREFHVDFYYCWNIDAVTGVTVGIRANAGVEGTGAIFIDDFTHDGSVSADLLSLTVE